MTSMTAGPSCAKAARRAASSSPERSIRTPCSPTRGDLGEAGVVEIRAEGDDPVSLHLQLHEGQGAVVEDDDLDRQVLLAKVSSSPISIDSPPSPERLTTWRPG